MPKHLGQVIRDLRKRAGVSQLSLARAAGIDPTLVSRIEAGSRDGMRFDNLCRVAKALEVSLDDLAAAAGLMPPRGSGAASRAPARLQFNDGLRRIRLLLQQTADQVDALEIPSQGTARKRKRKR